MNKHTKFQNLWNNCLTEEERIKRIRQAFNVVRKTAKKQLAYLQNHKKNNPPKEVGFLYFEHIIENIWENVDFIFSIKDKKYRNFSFYPTRCVMESAFRLDHFIRQNKKTQEDITIKECLRVLKRGWDMDNNKNNQEGMLEIKEQYDNFTSLGKGYPEIDKVTIKALEPFPNIFNILTASKVYDIGWYYHYGFLSELTHGKLMSIIIKNINLISEYRRSLMYLIIMGYRVLEVFDVYLFGKVRLEIQNAIKKADQIILKNN